MDEEDKAGSDGEEVDTAKDYQDLVFQLSWKREIIRK